LKGILAMLAVMKPGGSAFLSHATDEAENEKYACFHQFNFNCNKDMEFTITDAKGFVININKELLHVAVTTTVIQKVTRIRKL
jgi:hypothetical protein